MFNGMMKSDDVEVYQSVGAIGHYILSDTCKPNHIISSAYATYIELPMTANIGKVLTFSIVYGISGTGKGNTTNFCYITFSNTTLFSLVQGTVSFMYVGQQLNGLTATDKAKSGWIILGGVQGDTAITGYAGSVAIGSGAYCGGTTAIALGSGANGSTVDCIAIGRGANTTGATGLSLGVLASAASNGIAIGNSSASDTGGISIGDASNVFIGRGVAIGNQCRTINSIKISLKANYVFAAYGDAQAGKFILMRQTIDATPLVMSATNAAASTTNILILPNNGTYAFNGTVVAKDASTGDSAMWTVMALIKRGANASTTALVGTPIITKVFADVGATAWTIALTADTTNGGGAITVTGEAAKTIRWVSNIDSAEVI